VIPEVTIYITNYNYGKYISKAVNSCLKQTFKNLEILIIDDGSTDNSKKIINKFTSKNRNIFSIFRKNQGLIKSCNTALRAARGKYIMRLDADDWLDVNAIEIMHSKLEKNKKVELLFPDYYEVDENGKILHTIRRHNFENVKLLDQPAHGACTLFRTKTLILNGGYDENFTAQDGVDIWFRFQKKFKIMNINIPLFYYRKHGTSLSDNKRKILFNRSKILFKNSQINNNKFVEAKKTIALVPIRGEKYDKFSNVFKKIGKKYLIDWTLDNLLKSQLISDVIISSPDEKVLKYIKRKKNPRLIAIKRDPSLAMTNVLLDSSLNLALKKFKKLKGFRPDYTLLSKLSCPFRNHMHLDNAINSMKIFNLDMVLGVSMQNKMYFNHNGKTLKPLRTFDQHKLTINNKKRINIKIESEELYEESGNFILYNNKNYKNFKIIDKFKIGHEVLDKLSAFEISSSFEWMIAENISKYLKKFNQII